MHRQVGTGSGVSVRNGQRAVTESYCARMSSSPTPPFSPEWKPVRWPGCARMPGLFLHENLNKLQDPTGKTDGSTYPIEKPSCRKLVCLLNLSQTMTQAPSREGNWGYLGKSDGEVSFFFQKSLHLLCRLLLAVCQALNVKAQEQVLVN